MATLINGVVIKRFNTLLELYNYNSDRLGEEVYVLDTSGDNNSPGGYSIYKKNVGENNWDRIFDSISISTKLKELILDIDTFGNAVSLDDDIIEFSNATVLSITNENGNDVLIEDVIFSAGASNYPVKSSPNNIVVGQQYAGKKFRAICTVSNAVDKNTSFEDNPNLQLTKVNLELENVDNTSDINKPISTATQIALDTKVDKTGGSIIGKVSINTTNQSQGNFIIDSLGQGDKQYGFGIKNNDVWTHFYNQNHSNHSSLDVTSAGTIDSTSSTGYHFVMNPSGGNVGVKSIDLNYQFFVDGTIGGFSFTSTSDERAKEDIKDIDISIVDKLSKIEIKSFKFKKDDKKFLNYGVIAQQLQKIGLDDLVQKSNQIEYFKNIEDAKNFVEKNKDYSPKIEDFISKQEDKKDLKHKVSFSKLGVNYNNLFILQQTIINDLQSVLKTQNLFFSIDDIAKVYDNSIDDSYEVLTKDGNLIKSIEKNNNSQHQRIKVFIQNGGEVENKFSSKEDKIKYIQDINKSKISLFYSSKIVRKIDDKFYSVQNWNEECDTCKNIIIEYSALAKPTKDEKLELEKAKKIVSNTNFLVFSYRKYIKQNILNLQEIIEDSEVQNIFLDFVEQSSNKKYISKIKDILSV